MNSLTLLVIIIFFIVLMLIHTVVIFVSVSMSSVRSPPVGEPSRSGPRPRREVDPGLSDARGKTKPWAR